MAFRVIKFAEEDDHAPMSLWYVSNEAGLISVFANHLLHVSLA